MNLNDQSTVAVEGVLKGTPLPMVGQIDPPFQSGTDGDGQILQGDLKAVGVG
jgi:hypothetical protein